MLYIRDLIFQSIEYLNRYRHSLITCSNYPVKLSINLFTNLCVQIIDIIIALKEITRIFGVTKKPGQVTSKTGQYIFHKISANE